MLLIILRASLVLQSEKLLYCPLLQVLHYLDTIEPQELLSQMLATALCSCSDLLAAARGAAAAPVADLRRAVSSEMSAVLDLGQLQQQKKGESTGSYHGTALDVESCRVS